MDGNKKTIDNKPDVPYIVFEGELARAERHIKRLWIALITVTAALAVAVIAFFWYLSLYDFASYEYTQDGQGVNIVGDDNGVDYNGTESINPAQDAEGWKS